MGVANPILNEDVAIQAAWEILNVAERVVYASHRDPDLVQVVLDELKKYKHGDKAAEWLALVIEEEK